MTVWNDNVRAFTPRAEDRVDQERHLSVRTAVVMLHAGDDLGKVVEFLLDSVHRQARWTPPERPLRTETCFDCNHYGEGHCWLYKEAVDSEVFAARYCDDFELLRCGYQSGPWVCNDKPHQGDHHTFLRAEP